MHAKKILFAASEAAPLIKTGGLGDVAGSLPPELKTLRRDVRLVIPAYREVLIKCPRLTMVARADLSPEHSFRILEGVVPNTQIKLWLVDAPALFDRQGGPYSNTEGHDWSDNAERFAVFSRVVELLARNELGLDWEPNVVHCNDWQTGLVPALLARHWPRPATVFTVHNLAYQGNFSAETYADLRTRAGIPDGLMTMSGMEFHSTFSFIKGGLAYADMLNTVSPTYAREILTPEFGCGMEGLLKYRSERLRGILNGADYKSWDPAHDPLIAHHYDREQLANKAANKKAVQEHFGLPEQPTTPLLAMVGRLVEQKGGDLVLAAIPKLITKHKIQFVILGTGSARLEKACNQMMAYYPANVAAHVGFSEKMAHLIEAGADMFLMPSRFEPCGLNQLYSLRYGTVPIVRRTGGLADTVIDAKDVPDHPERANGFVFDEAEPEFLIHAIERALSAFQEQGRWQQLIRRGMGEDFSWPRSAKAYLDLYEEACLQRDRSKTKP